MKSFLKRLARSARRKIWSFIVAYMLGLHNFYYGDNRTPDSAANKIEHKTQQEDDSDH